MHTLYSERDEQMIYPTNLETKVAFDQVRQWVASKCLSTLGTERVEQMQFDHRPEIIETLLNQTAEFVAIIQGEEDFPSQYVIDVRPSLKRIRIEGLFLDENEVFDLRRSLETIGRMLRFVRPDVTENEKPIYPELYLLASEIQNFAPLVKKMDGLIDPFGKIKDNASPTLAQIRRELTTTTNSISQSLYRILRSAQQEGLVDKDVSPTLRDGRLVIPIVPALKRKIKGIVHDESATGKTVFVEPAEVVEANNRIRELEAQERREIIRILSEFSQHIRPLIPQLLEAYEWLAEMDFIRAKALTAIEMKAAKPILEHQPMLDWAEAVHPLLQRSLQKQDKQAIPLDIELDGDRRILLISGPNAGGKSVCLKTVGLLQYMLQCGMLIPMHERSHMGFFDSIFIDIGDEQSMEDDLSTYSSHLTNMKNMMKGCNGRSLILIDEFGSGTEPQIGGAIAEAVLKRFNQRQTFGVITTHYQNLKHYAEDHDGIVNGAMLYDRHQMQALYRLQIGNPGSSFAVEIARKIGLPEEVIADASELVGSEYIQSDKYLQDIVRDKRYWETKRQQIRKKEKQLEELAERYQKEMEELTASRKDVMRKAKEEAERLLKESNAAIENTIKAIKEAHADKDKTKQARMELDAFKKKMEETDKQAVEEQIKRKMQQLIDRQERKKNKVKTPSQPVINPSEPRSIEVGDFVRIKGQDTVGKVLELSAKNAVVMFGQMKTNVRIDRLTHAEEPHKEPLRQTTTTIHTATHEAMYQKKLHLKQDLDVRGMRGDEAVQAVTYFIDDAMLVGMNRVRILHGTGNGILRTLIRQYLATIGGIRQFADEHVQFGGAGITVVDFK